MTSLACVLDNPPAFDAVVAAFRVAFEHLFDVLLTETAVTPLAANAVLV